MQSEQKLGFDRIRAMVADECSNALAVRMTDAMTFMSDYEQVRHEVDLTEEMRQVMLMESSFPAQDYMDMSDVLTRLRVAGSGWTLPEMADMKLSLHTIDTLLHFFANDDNGSDPQQPSRYPCMYAEASTVSLDHALLRELDRIVDEKGEMYDNASETLLDIRRHMARKGMEIDRQVAHALNRAKREGWAPDNAEPTIRNGRPVIPMLDTHRRKIKGIIHDESATRQTAYLEPSEVVELNNDLRELQFDERHEIQRIMMQVADRIRPQIDTLLETYRFLARVDFLRAKARVALHLHAVHPLIEQGVRVEWYDARHPLLGLSSSNDVSARRREVVPFNLHLTPQKRILIVSGPNAGGKSVLLKAVGLIQYMLQCGMLVPCRENSEFGIFDNVFIDIGDQQSIDNDLSTYTSHLQNMKRLLQTAGAATLFLLDELGGGTEPRSGCAIAEAVLDELSQRGAWGVVTTHFADLKLLADDGNGIVNGAMLFDTDQMRPLYKLSVGLPGSSFAFEIATNVGFPQAILDRAAQKVGGEMLNFEHQLQQMEIDKQEIAKKQAELTVADDFLAEVTEKYQRLNERLESQKHEILSSARAEARKILEDANRTVERTINDIRTSQAERRQTLQARERMKAEHDRLLTEQNAHDEQRRQARKTTEKDEGGTADNRPVAVGMIVRIDDGDTLGQVVEMKGKKAVVESNSLRMSIAVDRLTPTAKKSLPKEKPSHQGLRFQSIYDDINEKRKYFNPTLDLRGQRAEEAIENLRRFLDEAQLLGEHELRILHGKGYGILKEIVKQQLQGNRDVASFGPERVELGGDGITVVHLK